MRETVLNLWLYQWLVVTAATDAQASTATTPHIITTCTSTVVASVAAVCCVDRRVLPH